MYYGLYSSRMMGKAVKDGSQVNFGYNATPKTADREMETVSTKVSMRSCARLIQKNI
jgi:hypothetical protein